MTKVLSYLLWCLPALAVGIGIEAAFMYSYPGLSNAQSFLWIAVCLSFYLFGHAVIARRGRADCPTVDMRR